MKISRKQFSRKTAQVSRDALFGLAFLLYLFKLSAENVVFNLLALGKIQWENKEHTQAITTL